MLLCKGIIVNFRIKNTHTFDLKLRHIYIKIKLWLKWNVMKTKLILVPFSFPCHSFCHSRLWGNQFCWRSVCLALGKRDNPKVICFNTIEGFDNLEMPVMKVGSVSSGKVTLYYCTGNRWKKFLNEKIKSEI